MFSFVIPLGKRQCAEPLSLASPVLFAGAATADAAGPVKVAVAVAPEVGILVVEGVHPRAVRLHRPPSFHLAESPDAAIDEDGEASDDDHDPKRLEGEDEEVGHGVSFSTFPAAAASAASRSPQASSYVSPPLFL
jgi:hypothetical protein